MEIVRPVKDRFYFQLSPKQLLKTVSAKVKTVLNYLHDIRTITGRFNSIKDFAVQIAAFYF
jgi:hypothetical protein